MNWDPTWMIYLLRLLILTNFVTRAKDKPEQIHLSLGVDSSSEMVVTWTTLQPPRPDALVYFGRERHFLAEKVTPSVDLFVDAGPAKTKRWIYRARLTSLEANTRYYYQVKGDEEIYSFRTLKRGSNWNPKLLIFGDLGFENSVCLPALIEEVRKDTYDVVIHAGDIGYDMNQEEGHLGDKFMNLVEPIASVIPYQVAMGNHEEAYNFSHYQARFTMFDQTSGSQQNSFYSFNLGPIHVVVFSSEFYEFTKYGTEQIESQLNWLKGDLEEANSAENRKVRPWIVTISHKPLYCDEGRCLKDASTLRKGLEKLLYEAKVDLMFVGHEHKYQRSWPVYNGKVYNGSMSNPYANALAPVQIVTGAAGNREKLGGHKEIPGEVLPWRAKTIVEYSYTRLLVVNDTHLLIQQLSSSQVVLDDFYLSKGHRSTDFHYKIAHAGDDYSGENELDPHFHFSKVELVK